MKKIQDKLYDEEELSDDSSSASNVPWVRSDLMQKKKSHPYYDTGDLVTIALLSALGGVLSTFIGYIGNLINHLLGVPFGAGQIIAGMHIFWITLIYLLTGRKIGTALLAGLIKGFVELFSGSTHGLLVVAISGTQGFLIEIFFIIFLSTNSKFIISVASGFSSMSNVVLQQILFFNSQIPPYIIMFICIISFISGVIFGGLFAISMFNIFKKSTILNWKKPTLLNNQPRNIRVIRILLISTIILIEIGIFSYVAFQNQSSIEVSGNVDHPYEFYISDFPQITIEAELIGDVTYIPPRNYTGVSLLLAINKAQPKSEDYIAKIIASDGYYKEFTSNEVKNDPTIILSITDNGIGVVAGNFHGSFWVKNVNRIEII